jgi:hypothetical protein
MSVIEQEECPPGGSHAAPRDIASIEARTNFSQLSTGWTDPPYACVAADTLSIAALGSSDAWRMG